MRPRRSSMRQKRTKNPIKCILGRFYLEQWHWISRSSRFLGHLDRIGILSHSHTLSKRLTLLVELVRPLCIRFRKNDLEKKNRKPFSCFAYMLVWFFDYSIGEYSLMSYTGCSRLPQSTATAVGEFQEDQWAPIDRVGEFTSAFRLIKSKIIQLITRPSDIG